MAPVARAFLRVLLLLLLPTQTWNQPRKYRECCKLSLALWETSSIIS
jgi:hypothetical protein